MQGWIDLFRSLGESLIEVVRAETTALQADLKTSGRHMRWALAFFGAAALLSFWVLGLLVFLLVTLIDIWLPLPAAAGIVFGVFLVAMAILAWLGSRRLKLVENPVDSVKRHMDDHLDWWQNGLLAQGKAMDIPSASVPVEGEELP
ncbi:MAG TPA: phage holin family protein [Thermoanaerobaculia bacterium]|nr:phage holin family protein [Thermoanaerobaculia bacterium]